MEWNAQQDRALSDVRDWMTERDSQVYRLFGYAGTGKTTLARHLAEGVEGDVLFAAYTGKAAYVLQQKGCPAQTIHSLIYTSSERAQRHLKELEEQLQLLFQELMEDGVTAEDRARHQRVIDIKAQITEEKHNVSRPLFRLNTESIVREASLLVLDEVSMVDMQMGEDLLYFGTKVLVLGDPFQLPPIRGEGFFTDGHKPDTMLTDIRRQERDNPIIQLATTVREGGRLDLGRYGESAVVPVSEITPERALEADQLLVGRNATRRSTNVRVRQLKGYEARGALPVEKDRLVCLRNDHDAGLLNGAIWQVEEALGSRGDGRVLLRVSPEGEDRDQIVEAHAHYFEGRGEQLPWYERKQAQEFDYGYALTVHKSQGSQWNDVVLFDESGAFREHRDRWLYTGITRAAQKTTIARMA